MEIHGSRRDSLKSSTRECPSTGLSMGGKQPAFAEKSEPASHYKQSDVLIGKGREVSTSCLHSWINEQQSLMAIPTPQSGVPEQISSY